MDIKENFATNLARYRKALNLTQAEFAEKINYSDKAISKWERAESLPDVIVIKQIADFFKVTVDTLIDTPKEDKPKLYKNLSRKRISIACLSAAVVWLVAVCAFFFIGQIFTNIQHSWMAFVFAVPITLIILLILTSVWGKTFTNLIISSFFVWTAICSVFLTILLLNPLNSKNIWQVFLIGVPIQAILIFYFFYKRAK